MSVTFEEDGSIHLPLAMDIEEPWIDLPEEEDWLVGKTCNPDAPEECESCQ